MLNRFMRKKRLKPEFRVELREYLINSRQMQMDEAFRELLQMLSPGLQGRLSMELMFHILEQVSTRRVLAA